ncbi:hypothetical protein PRZ48_010775 [Zasmidium cellare]|uniref:Zinc transporter n=1 Tax=Zasmidium cellare TaxID=395010 RepID=A0ABR0E9X4_ZASCE|nr:hypothetical protein PRZ48_010775 [Zasmidium cellare]
MLSPAKEASTQNHSHSHLPTSNGNTVKHVASKGSLDGSLHTLKESSRETSPLASPYHEHDHPPSFEQNQAAVRANGSINGYLNGHIHDHHDHHHEHSHAHTHSHNHLSLPMKSRPRGESDLGRPASSYTSVVRNLPAASASWFSLPEALTSLLIPVPYIFASMAYCNHGDFVEDGLPPLSAYARLQKSVLDEELPARQLFEKTGCGFVEACTLTSGTLLLVGILAKIRSSERMLDRRKDKPEPSPVFSDLLSAGSLQRMAIRSLSVGLPFYASLQIGGMRTGLILLTAIASNITNPQAPSSLDGLDWKHVLKSRIGSTAILALSMLLDFTGITFRASSTDLVLGYLALFGSLFIIQPSLPAVFLPSSSSASSSTPTTMRSPWSQPATSPLVSSIQDVNMTLTAGVLMSLITLISSFIFATSPPITLLAIVFSTLSLGSSAAAILFARPSALRSPYKAGLGLGCFAIATCAFLFSPSLWPGTILNGGLSGLSYFGVLLNFAFMFVQGVYGYISGSLGLLSDTVHMFFDCLGLVVGLGAAVASKWPTSPERPYGWGKLNTLAGFGNGIFLMLVSIEFIWEAVEGMVEGKELRHVQELLVVSTLGFVVNMIGLFAFGHAHAGHDHGHGHSHGGHSHDHHTHDHSHSHDHGHSHDHSHANHAHKHSHDSEHSHHGHSHVHDHSHSHAHDHSHSHAPAAHSHDHGHDHHNENMHGIFLHVAADAGGSLAVILSTAMTLWKPWYLWDPLATIIIAILIFAAAVPLVTSSGQKLLLVIPDQLEYNIKDTLQELGELRGVVGYAVPRFWLDDKEDAADSHGHHHGHDHGPSHGKDKVMGVIHIIANPNADVDDVRHRVVEFVRERNMDLVVHVEREGEASCWCGGSSAGWNGSDTFPRVVKG